MSRFSTSSVLVWSCLLATAACSAKDAAPAAPVLDARVVVVDAGVTQIKPFDPSGGMHLDDDGDTLPTVIGSGAAVKGKRPSRPIDVILRTTPPGARAAVDGVFVGTTPTYWAGDADGREHEFTFVLAKHESGRYRFVPLTSGVVHAKLDPVSEDVPAANLEPVLVPLLARDAGVMMAPPVVVDAEVRAPAVIVPPPTVLTPDAAQPPVDAASVQVVAPDAPAPGPVDP